MVLVCDVNSIENYYYLSGWASMIGFIQSNDELLDSKK